MGEKKGAIFVNLLMLLPSAKGKRLSAFRFEFFSRSPFLHNNSSKTFAQLAATSSHQANMRPFSISTLPLLPYGLCHSGPLLPQLVSRVQKAPKRGPKVRSVAPRLGAWNQFGAVQVVVRLLLGQFTTHIGNWGERSE